MEWSYQGVSFDGYTLHFHRCPRWGTKNYLTSPIDEETFGNQSILDFLNVQTVSESLMSITLLLHFHRPRAQQMDHSERLS